MVIVLASHNKGKLAEMQALLAPLGHTLMPQANLGIAAAAEPFDTFIENALVKARHAAQSSGHAALADDSGLCVQALDGAPGVYSARYAPSIGQHVTQDAANNALLLQRMSAFEKVEQRHAHFTAVLVAVRSADDPEPLIAEGRWQGVIAHVARGENGFGYDSLFMLPELNLTSAQLSAEEKNRISHRAIAMRQLALLMRERWAAT